MPDIQVLLVEPGQQPRTTRIPLTADAIGELVDGMFERVLLDPELPYSLVINEEGKLLNLTPNRRIRYEYEGLFGHEVFDDTISGTFLVCRDGADDFASLLDSDIPIILDRLLPPGEPAPPSVRFIAFDNDGAAKITALSGNAHVVVDADVPRPSVN